MPVAHPSCSKESEKRGEVAGQQINCNRRLIVLEEEKDKVQDQAINLNQEIEVIHPRIENSAPASDQLKDQSLCF